MRTAIAAALVSFATAALLRPSRPRLPDAVASRSLPSCLPAGPASGLSE